MTAVKGYRAVVELNRTAVILFHHIFPRDRFVASRGLRHKILRIGNIVIHRKADLCQRRLHIVLRHGGKGHACILHRLFVVSLCGERCGIVHVNLGAGCSFVEVDADKVMVFVLPRHRRVV